MCEQILSYIHLLHSHSEFWFHLSSKPHVSSLRPSLSALRKEDGPGVSPEEHRLVFILTLLPLPLQYCCSQSGNHHCHRHKDAWGLCVSHLSIPIFLFVLFLSGPILPWCYNVLLNQSDHNWSVLNTDLNSVQNIVVFFPIQSLIPRSDSQGNHAQSKYRLF